jgi:hypothetical protein
VDDTIEVYRNPGSAGYAETRTAKRGERVDSSSMAGVGLDVGEIVGQ